MASQRLCFYLLSCVLLCSLAQFVRSQVRPLPAPDLQRRNNTCMAASSCSACIQKAGCVWCIPDTLTDQSVATCQGETTPCLNGSPVLPKGEVSGPGNSGALEEKYNMALTTDVSNLKLRVGETLNVEMTLRVSSDGLLDLYYLTDLSTSMNNDLQYLGKSGGNLITALENKTNNFRIGFGTFIDKKMYPYYDIKQNTMKEPTDPCQKTYGFCNSMNLTEDGKEQFLRTVENSQIGDNMDRPEGGLDALMQVLVCEEAIGWRKSALKIVLYTCESAFHISGDGKLAGIYQINDGLCHLDPGNKYYTEGYTTDYPSVPQIARAAKDNNINVIFAVEGYVLKLYEMLAEHVPGSTATTLVDDSYHIVDLVTKEFDKIRESFELKAESSREVSVNFKYECPRGSSSKCEGLELGQNYKVTAEVTLLRCPPDINRGSRQLVLSAIGLISNVVIDLDYICSCDCEKVENTIAQSPQCNNTGTYQCGQCECPAGLFGPTCSCKELHYRNTTACTVEGQSTHCSGRGECMCQKCVCDEDYYGEWCECVDRGCPVHAGLECNSHGDCQCKECQCHSGWSGDRCSCSSETSQCYLDKSEEPCSGNGVCECNSCKCSKTGILDDRFFEPYCKDCPTCGGECSNQKICVLCHLYENNQKDKVITSVNGTTCAATHQQCSQLNITLIKDESMINTTIYSNCSLQENGCTRYFFYRGRNNNYQMVIVDGWTCPLKWWEILLSVVVPMVFIGLLTLLIWYCIHQRNLKIEAEKMEADTAAVWASKNVPQYNLYRDPVSHLQNPLFGKAM